MNTRRTRTTFVTAATLAAGSSALAGVDFGNAPDGYTPIVSLSGSDGSPHNADRWFVHDDTGAIRTNWANKKITFDASALPEDDYKIGITARNGGNLPLASNFDAFKVDATLDGDAIAYRAQIAASDTDWNTLWLDAGTLEGDASLTLNWRNDSYRRGEFDANITYGAVTFAARSVPAPGAAGLATVGLIALVRRRR